MVGYNKDDRMTNEQKLLAGCFSGVMTRFITQPMDVVKIRTQLQKKLPRRNINMIRTTMNIFKEEGIFAFWHGHNLGQIHSILGVSSQFFVYEMATKYVANTTIDDEYKRVLVFLSGIFAGCCSATLVFPLEVIRVRQMLVEQQYRGVFRGARKVYTTGGILAFYKGLSASLLQIHSILGVSSQFFVYEMATKYVANTTIDDEYKRVLVFLSGIFAGCCSATLVFPLEVIRVRQMLVEQQYRGVFRGARKVYTTGGILAFYKGLSASLLQMGPQVGISFWVFSFMQPLILSYFQRQDCKKGNCTSGNVHRPENILVASTIAGSASGFFSKTATYPFDLAKRRMQVGTHIIEDKYKPPSTAKHVIRCKALANCIIRTYQLEGFFGLYRGWKVTIAKAQVTSIVAFTTYELICYAIREMTNA